MSLEEELEPVYTFEATLPSKKSYLNRNVMMYFLNDLDSPGENQPTLWRIQVDDGRTRDIDGSIKRMDTDGNTIPSSISEVEKAIKGAFTGVSNVEISLPNNNGSSNEEFYWNANRNIAFTLSGNPDVLAQYVSEAFGPAVARGRTIIGETGVMKRHDFNTCVYGLIMVDGNPPFPPLHEIFYFFDALRIPRDIIRWFTHCINIDAWKQSRMQ